MGEPPKMESTAMATNPGTYEELHRKCKETFPILFEGGKVMLQKGLSNHFQISHTVSLSPQSNTYRFGATYVGFRMFGPQEAFPVLLGDTDFNGNVSATLLHKFSERTQIRLQSQLTNGKLSVAQLSTEYKGRLATSSLTLANNDLVNNSGIICAQYLRRVMPRLDVGMEMVYQYGAAIPGGRLSNLSYAARYNGDVCTAAASVSNSSVNLSYYHKQMETAQFGVEWETSIRAQESVASFAYQMTLPELDTTIKATVDSQWTVGCLVEKRLTPLPFTLALSGMLNHVKQSTKFGIGLIIG